MTAACFVLEPLAETAGRITMAGLTFVIVALFLVLVIGSKTRRGR